MTPTPEIVEVGPNLKAVILAVLICVLGVTAMITGMPHDFIVGLLTAGGALGTLMRGL